MANRCEGGVLLSETDRQVLAFEDAAVAARSAVQQATSGDDEAGYFVAELLTYLRSQVPVLTQTNSTFRQALARFESTPKGNKNARLRPLLHRMILECQARSIILRFLAASQTRQRTKNEARLSRLCFDSSVTQTPSNVSIRIWKAFVDWLNKNSSGIAKLSHLDLSPESIDGWAAFL